MRVFNRLLSKTLQEARQGGKSKAVRGADMISCSPHPVSNLRLIQFTARDDETDAERNYRIARAELQSWNQRYWENHNREFYKVP